MYGAIGWLGLSFFDPDDPDAGTYSYVQLSEGDDTYATTLWNGGPQVPETTWNMTVLSDRVLEAKTSGGKHAVKN
jgi:hypothetical protein